MARILMHALVRIDPDGSGTGQSKSPARQHPVLDQIVNQTLAQLELEHFAQPLLRHVERQERSGDDAENSELHQELRKVAARKRIIKRLVPTVEANLSVGQIGRAS